MKSVISKKYEIIAKDLISKMDREYKDVYISGSTALGYADEFSDIEIDIYVSEISETIISELKGLVEWCDWEPRLELEEDGAQVIETKIDDVRIELVISTYENIRRVIQGFTTDTFCDHETHVHLWTIQNYTRVRESKLMSNIFEQLEVYTKDLSNRIIDKLLSEKITDHEVRLGSVKRKQNFLFHQKFGKDIEVLLRYIYAINRRYEPYWKWIEKDLRKLTYLPDNFEKDLARLLLSERTNKKKLQEFYGLYLKVLKLIKSKGLVSKKIEETIVTIESILQKFD